MWQADNASRRNGWILGEWYFQLSVREAAIRVDGEKNEKAEEILLWPQETRKCVAHWNMLETGRENTGMKSRLKP